MRTTAFIGISWNIVTEPMTSYTVGMGPQHAYGWVEDGMLEVLPMRGHDCVAEKSFLCMPYKIRQGILISRGRFGPTVNGDEGGIWIDQVLGERGRPPSSLNRQDRSGYTGGEESTPVRQKPL